VEIHIWGFWPLVYSRRQLFAKAAMAASRVAALAVHQRFGLTQTACCHFGKAAHTYRHTLKLEYHGQSNSVIQARWRFSSEPKPFCHVLHQL
jgi:hypothetical protein